MGFSAKRAKAVAKGKVNYCIYLGESLEFSSKSFIVAVQMADTLQKQHPENNYTMKVVVDE